MASEASLRRAQAGWSDRPNNVHFYPAGTWGPGWADAFIERDGRQWRKM